MRGKGLQNMQPRGMRNDAAMVTKSQHPENKDPGEVTPSPSDEQVGDDSHHISIKLPKALESNAHKTGEMVTHLAQGHHVKHADGTTHFHMKSLDGEPVQSSDVQPPEPGMDAGGTNGDMSGSPYGIAQAMSGMSQ